LAQTAPTSKNSESPSSQNYNYFGRFRCFVVRAVVVVVVAAAAAAAAVSIPVAIAAVEKYVDYGERKIDTRCRQDVVVIST